MHSMRLIALGHKDMRWMPGGILEWTGDGMPLGTCGVN